MVQLKKDHRTNVGVESFKPCVYKDLDEHCPLQSLSGNFTVFFFNVKVKCIFKPSFSACRHTCKSLSSQTFHTDLVNLVTFALTCMLKLYSVESNAITGTSISNSCCQFTIGQCNLLCCQRSKAPYRDHSMVHLSLSVCLSVCHALRLLAKYAFHRMLVLLCFQISD